MRLLLPVLVLLPALAVAQPGGNEGVVSDRFTRLVGLAHADSSDAAMALMACPVEDAHGRLVPGACDPGSAAHRLRVETQFAMLNRLFPDAITTLRPNYRREQEGDTVFDLLLFQGLDAAPFALVSFTEFSGSPRYVETQVQEPLNDLRAPASLLAAFEALMQAAAEPGTTAETFAPLTVARSGDERAWTVAADPAIEDDRRVAAALLRDLRTHLAGDSDYAVAGFEWDRESEGTWYVLHVRFAAGEEPVAFAFLPIGDRVLLGDVD